MLNSVKSGLGDTQAQAEAAAVQACKAAGGGSAALPGHAMRGHGSRTHIRPLRPILVALSGASDTPAVAPRRRIRLRYPAVTSRAAPRGCAGAAQAQTGDPCVSVVHRGGDSVRRATACGRSPHPRASPPGVSEHSPGAHQAGVTVTASKLAAWPLSARCTAGGVQNAYSAIYMGANDSWSISEATSPSRANERSRYERQTVKAAGLTPVLKGSGSTDDSWMAQILGWIDQPMPLPSQPSPTFVCVTGPGGSCLQPGAGSVSAGYLGIRRHPDG